MFLKMWRTVISKRNCHIRVTFISLGQGDLISLLVCYVGPDQEWMQGRKCFIPGKKIILFTAFFPWADYYIGKTLQEYWMFTQWNFRETIELGDHLERAVIINWSIEDRQRFVNECKTKEHMKIALFLCLPGNTPWRGSDKVQTRRSKCKLAAS